MRLADTNRDWLRQVESALRSESSLLRLADDLREGSPEPFRQCGRVLASSSRTCDAIPHRRYLCVGIKWSGCLEIC